MHQDIENLIKITARMPGIGKRSARRIVLEMIKKREHLMHPMIAAMQKTYENIVSCEICGNLDAISPCSICSDPKRDKSSICIVEDVSDLWAMERSLIFRGYYHVLGGTLSAIDGIGPDKLRIESLLRRAEQQEVKEIILATNATMEGQTTAYYITEKLENCNIKITKLAQGIPIGGELDYLDDGTLGTAMKERLPF